MLDRHAFDDATQAVEDITGDYTLDASHTRIGFSARHAMVTTVRGQFDEFEGTAHIDTANPASSSVTLTIQAASVTTGNEQRDGHLSTADFFDIENYPTASRFVSTDVARDGDRVGHHRRPDHQGRHQARSRSTSRRPARPRTRSATCASASRVSTTINRTDWGLTFNAALETGGVLVSEKIKLEFDISAIAQSA